MAKNKLEESKYKKEGRRRIAIRQAKRKSNWSSKVRRYGRGTRQCEYCGGNLSWCSCCEVWSRNCCIEYGTCECS